MSADGSCSTVWSDASESGWLPLSRFSFDVEKEFYHIPVKASKSLVSFVVEKQIYHIAVKASKTLVNLYFISN